MKRMLSLLFVGGLTACFFLVIAGCTTSDTGRFQLNLISADQEMQLGLTAFDQMKKDVPISKNPEYNALVAKVGARIAEQAKSRLPDAKWEFVVFESTEANAFCLPGGKVGVYTGILPITKTEEGLATVIGHEVAHASQHHGAERMSDALALQKAAGWATSAVSDKYQAAAAVAFGYGEKAGELGFSRTHESEADHVGLLYMARAGYNPEEAIRFWERFSEINKGQAGANPLQNIKWFRTHPLDAQRIADLKKWLPEAKAQMKAAGK